MKTITTILLFVILLPANGQAPNDTYLQAKADMIRKQYAAAEQKIISIPADKRTPSMYLTLGESYYHAGKYLDAARAFIMADSLKAFAEAKLYAARAYAMLSQPDKATEWLQKYLMQREKLSEGEIDLDPAFAKIGHSKEWKTLWSKEWYNTAERKSAEAAIRIKHKKYTEALTIIDAEIANRPTSSARFYALRAKAYEAMEQYEPAYESAQTAVQMRSNNVPYYVDAAKIAVRVKKYDTALDNINRAIRYDPYRLELYLQRAAILRMSKRYDDARNDINFYFKYLPSDAGALYQMGMAETDAGNPLAGIEYFTMLIDNDRTKPDYFVARANAGIRAGNYEMADRDLSQALDLNPSIPDAWCKKGIVLQQANKLEDACYYWKTALKMGNREAAEYIYRYCTN